MSPWWRGDFLIMSYHLYLVRSDVMTTFCWLVPRWLQIRRDAVCDPLLHHVECVEGGRLYFSIFD